MPAAGCSRAVAGFADATGRFLPLVRTLNAGLVLSATAARRPGARATRTADPEPVPEEP
jgi:hypothetical protein